MMQNWYCEICKKSGTVSTGGLWFNIVSRIGRDHKAKSPACVGNAQKVFPSGDGYDLTDAKGVAVIVRHKAKK